MHLKGGHSATQSREYTISGYNNALTRRCNVIAIFYIATFQMKKTSALLSSNKYPPPVFWNKNVYPFKPKFKSLLTTFYKLDSGDGKSTCTGFLPLIFLDGVNLTLCR